ncbi:sensor domain-containing diguanylate cyclase [Alteromonas lipolytica]|uniref:diguanylate cyclase n=1 Tax=Alteromonas lipolytica TaxID=1856405 RepID=A0A1E8FFH8_9ALTE|nr:diguanylate cyclase [Alteromonas lipolytica]OFI34684.1 hypothetical protein BFC17_13960 [Alteromonas lipolytica]GGF53151.1 deoxynucleoside kinase [Alteromonas lipolytica]
MALPKALLSFFLYSLILICSASAKSQSVTQNDSLQVNILPAGQQHSHLSAGMYYFRVGTKLSLQQAILRPPRPWVFRANSSLHLTDEDQYTWIKMPLQRANNAGEQWIMTIDWPLIRAIDWYHVTGENNQLQAQGSFTNWQIPPGAPDEFPFAIELKIESHATETLYLRIQHSEKALVPVTFWTPETFASHKLDRNWFLGLFYGVLLAMFAYNLSLFAFVQNRGFASYCFYVLTMAAYTSVMNGSGVAWLWSAMPEFLDYAYRITVPLAFLGAVVFIRDFLMLKKQGAFFDITSQLACAIWVLFLLLIPFVSPAVLIPAIEVFGFINCVYGFTTSSYLWWKRDASAKYLTLSWAILIFSTVILIMGLRDFIPYQIELHYLQNVGVTIEVLLLSMALAERINRERQMRFEAQDMALQMSKEASKAKESEVSAQERLLGIERRVKEELSLKVHEQTRELKVAMQKLQIMNKELERLSLTDALTGLANRRHFDDRLADEINRATRNETSLGLLMLDIDHFKQINDTFGHPAGDKVIQTLSALIQRVSGRASDLPARVGGEEFCLLVAGETASSVAQLAENLRQTAQNETAVHENNHINYTVSIGFTCITPSQIITASSLMKQADDALYKAKRGGRNCVVNYALIEAEN